MYDESGLSSWRVELDGYGKATLYNGSSLTECPFRYQGQYEDPETGLYYNRFRYYDTEQGNYISQDPIGVLGGNPTLYGYVKDVNIWVDTLGLYNGEGVRDLDAYHSFHDHTLDSTEYTLTDKEHFAKSNESLHNRFQNDPKYAAMMEKKYPGINKHVAPTKNGTYRGTAPKGTTWHHATSSQVGKKGVLQLVDMQDHAMFHKIYHPDDIGGRNEWGGGTSCRK